MSKLIPPLVSSSPPPIVGPLEEDDDDEFGNFRAAESYECDDLSLPSSPKKAAQNVLDINSNQNEKERNKEKDFQDRRKSEDDCEDYEEVNSSFSDIYDFQPEQAVLQCDEPQNLELGSSNNQAEDEPSIDEISSEKQMSDEINEINEDDLQFESAITSEEKFDNSSKDVHTESSISIKVDETDSKVSDDEFGDFENHFVENVDRTNIKDEDEEEEFGDFAESVPLGNQENIIEEEIDEFGDFETVNTFAELRVEEQLKPTVKVDVENALIESESILKEIFPVSQENSDNFTFFDETKGNVIFDELKDVTESKALIYQWSKSNSQKMFLKALNIDTRNILYGPVWNSSIPRFAANLGVTPLEPIKSEILTHAPAQSISSPSISSQKNLCSDIPTAQFDWSGSGLVNPLDYSQTMLLDLEQLVVSLDIPSTNNPCTNQPSSPYNELMDEWDLWLQSTATDPEESNNESNSRINTDFLPRDYDKTRIILDQDKIIENENNSQKLDDFSTFHSPKLIPLRETHISNDNDFTPSWLEPTIVTPDLPRKEPMVDPELEEEEEFDDFQMVLPEENKSSQYSVPEEHIEDEEFTEFHSSMPTFNDIKPLEPKPVTLTPLKPQINYTTPTQINWPDPGITDADIRNIELSYSRKGEVVAVSPSVETTLPIKETILPIAESVSSSKENISLFKGSKNIKKTSFDEDEWSDFVSVTKPVLSERTATPDLPLSVLNLNHVQAPKQPIPVITPSGLVQTKLSSNIILQPQVVQKTVQPMKPQSTPYQPSIISNQFAANFPESTDDDDDWSDFVSGQPPQQINGFQQKFSTAPPQQKCWTTNIITNPSHFDSLQGTAQQTRRNVAPTLATMPELDFIAPRNRTSKK